MTAPALVFGDLARLRPRRRHAADKPRRDLCTCDSCCAGSAERRALRRRHRRELRQKFDHIRRGEL